MILLMILAAACRPQNPAPFFDSSWEKPGIQCQSALVCIFLGFVTMPAYFLSHLKKNIVILAIELSKRFLLPNLPFDINDACGIWVFDAAVVSYSSPKLVILHMNMALHVYDDIMRMTENLSEKYVIGHGASSTVYKCMLKNCKPVAIKRLYQYPQSLKEFETELETVGSIKHRNLVSLQGYSLSPCGNLLFFEYMENGSLWDHLHGKFVSYSLIGLQVLVLYPQKPDYLTWGLPEG